MRTFATIILLGVLASPSALAQAYITPPPIQMPMNLQFSNAMISKANSRAAERAARKRTIVPSQMATPVKRQELRDARLALAFSVDDDLRTRMTSDMRGRVAARSPEDADAFEDALFPLMSNVMRPYGLSVNDLADTTTVYLSEMWDAANGTSTDLNKRTM